MGRFVRCRALVKKQAIAWRKFRAETTLLL
jgi:hypothetical protein